MVLLIVKFVKMIIFWLVVINVFLNRLPIVPILIQIHFILKLNSKVSMFMNLMKVWYFHQDMVVISVLLTIFLIYLMTQVKVIFKKFGYVFLDL